MTIKPIHMNERTAIGSLPKRNLLLRTGQFLGRKGLNFLRLFKKKNTYVEIICAMLIILFVYTGLNKMMDYSNFKLQLGRSPFIGKINGFIAATLPTGELLISFALIPKWTRLLGLYLSFVLMALFTGYIWLMLNFASDLPCSCGGVLAKMTWNDHLYFNAGFTILAIAGVILENKLIKKFNTNNALERDQ